MKAFQDLATLGRSGRLPIDEAQTIVSKLGDRYDHLETHVTIQNGGNEASKIRRAELLRYIRLRRDAIELVETEIRNDELPDAQKIRSKIEEGNRMAAALAQPVPWY